MPRRGDQAPVPVDILSAFLPEYCRTSPGEMGETMLKEMLKRSALLILVAAASLAGCTSDNPTAPTTVTVSPLPPIVVSLPTTVPGVLSLVMPVDPFDLATTSF